MFVGVKGKEAAECRAAVDRREAEVRGEFFLECGLDAFFNISPRDSAT